MKRLLLIAILASLLLTLISCANHSMDIATATGTINSNIAKANQIAVETLPKPSNHATAITKIENEMTRETATTASIDKILKNPEITPGRFVVNGDWVYFIKLLDTENTTTAIFKMNIETQKSILVCKDEPYNIFTDGNWIYYNTISDGVSNPEDISSELIDIYKIKPDGGNRTLLLKGSWLENVKDGWIYYSKIEKSNEEESNYLFRVKTNGLNLTKLGKGFLYTQFVDKYIYYLNNYQLGRIKLDGSSPKIICKENQLDKDTYFQRFLVKGNVLYFSTTNLSETKNEKEGLFRVNLDGTDMENILYANIHDSDFIVYKDKILYVSVEPPKENLDKISDFFTYTLNEFDTKSKKSKKLFQIYDGSLYLLGDWLYYSKSYGRPSRLNLTKY